MNPNRTRYITVHYKPEGKEYNRFVAVILQVILQ